MSSEELNRHGERAGSSAETAIREIKLLIQAKYPIVYLLTWEEERVTRQIQEIAGSLGIQNVRCWSASKGFSSDSARDQVPDAIAALDEIAKAEDNGISIFYDFHAFLSKESAGRALFTRKLRDLAIEFRQNKNMRTLILVSPVPAIPDELEKDVTLIDYPLPEVPEIEAILNAVVADTGTNYVLSDEDKDKMLRAALGLTENEIRNVFSKALVGSGRIDRDDISFILEEKKQIIRKSGILEYYELQDQFDSIGGLGVLKDWLRQRANSFTEKARGFGLPEPKGILLVGVPGCGKSLSAKAVAWEWKQPLLRLDIGKIFGGLVGASEENIRRSIKIAGSVSPTILWMDEIEKGFAGMKSSGDSGVTARVFGTLLTWMQEKTKPVFVIATANDISKLPPELLRKGRFDEIFFVDLPAADEIQDIFGIHLRKRSRDPQGYDLKALAKKAEGYTGAEIEQVIVSALYDAYNSGRALDTSLIEKNLKETVPLSRTMETEITALRRWAQKRARLASGTGRQAPTPPTGAIAHDRKFRVPFRFGNEKPVETFGEFVEGCRANEAEIKEALEKGRLEAWLRANGLDALAEEAARVKEYSNTEFGVAQFVSAVENAMR